jgi:phenylpropionate dioxygenase-like ring-hydroxylating dioxygenase large terminal subunit
VNGCIECPYHGWRYDVSGVCRLVPALGKPPAYDRRLVPAYAATESQGYVWIHGRPDVVPASMPFLIPEFTDKRYATVAADFQAEATLFDALENQVDVPHTSIVHAGMFRGRNRSRISVRTRRSDDRVETEYHEDKPPGIVGRLMVPGKAAGIVHIDRFILPSIIQVEYQIGTRAHILITNILTPISKYHIRFWSVVRFRAPLGRLISGLFGEVIGRRFIAEDAQILKLQSEAIQKNGEKGYVSTEADVMGPHIADLLRRAAKGPIARSDPAAPHLSTSTTLLL